MAETDLIRMPAVLRTNQAAADVIRDAILDGRLPMGRRLLETELAAELGISRTPVREALLLLTADGLLDNVPGKGVTVRRVSDAEVEHIYAMRSMLEGYAARLAAPRITEAQVRLLHESCQRLGALPIGSAGALNVENIAFHNVVLDAANVAPLRPIVRRLLDLPLACKQGFWDDEANRDASVAAHSKILRALEAGDADRAESEMRIHLADAGHRIVSAGTGEGVR